MYIPFDNLYDFVNDFLDDDDLLIYRFLPHGSKNLQDLSQLNDRKNNFMSLRAIMYDQEPFQYDLYHSEYLRDLYISITELPSWCEPIHFEILNQFKTDPRMSDILFGDNLNSFCRLIGYEWHDKNIIFHSEKNSNDIKHIADHDLEPVYWWSHAMIARDWFRYANTDPRLAELPDQYPIDFCCYNRAWSGTREYRLKFLDLLIEHNLIKNFKIGFNPIDSGKHYLEHDFKNPAFLPKNDFSGIPENNAPASSSACYDSDDYINCWIDIVLETIFDDTKNHITEKTLRPIACGKPFILLSSPGSLAYLQSYGFRTFSGLFDESYDTIRDPVDRLNSVIRVIKSLSSLDIKSKRSLHESCKEITQHNKKLFFSSGFANNILDELKINYLHAKSACEQSRLGTNWVETRKTFFQKKSNLHWFEDTRFRKFFKHKLKMLYDQRLRIPSQSGGGSCC
jgi:hypothetical protein